MKTKKQLKNNQKTTGRPLKITPSILAKLEDAGLSDKEACLQANINPATLYRYQQENPTFCDRKEQWKNTTTIKAKKVIVQAIEKWDVNLAKWWLERKAKEEFSTRTELTGKDNETITDVTFNIIPALKDPNQ